ncbi:cytochrome P450 CYP736A12-like [Pyrus ussuriensis x Pyrus communis]|uniref:Cytochrome P450 CYP736A12-like n=1 Tax=Pyrus ussuriensis x Pyrus communis TaxID=2448454 RepID=A0A5N5I7T2_9ROSA|nr:cytochrome P450 CYP736A12-like [Pyrus ussuriensis x Pyrus communis]
MISGALDMSATAIVWILAELLRHPRAMKFLQREFQTIIGMDRTDSYMDYLNKVVKESVRFHLVAPLLIPHASMEDVTVGQDVLSKRF